MMPIKLCLLLVLLMSISCTHNNNSSIGIKEIKIKDKVVLKVPADLKFSERKGIDSYTFEISDSTGFSLKGDFGIYSNDFSGPQIVAFDISEKDSVLKRSNYKLDTSLVFFTKSPKKDMQENIFAKEYYLYDTIDKLVVKIIQPKKISNGITALYVPSLDGGNENLMIYGNNLDSSQHIKALSIFNSIKRIE